MRRRAGRSELDALLGLHAGGEVVLGLGHLGDEVGGGEELGLGVAAGDDDVEVGAAGGEGGDDRGASR